MSDEQRRDRQVAERLPITWPVFFAKFGRLTPVQREAIPTILAGRDVVLAAPTASGKTEAVCAPLVERWCRSRPWMVLYVSPTRALVNDLFNRLSGPIENLGFRVARRTGDHNQRPAEATNLLLTTPESFDSLLCRASTAHGHLLGNVCAVVLDEVHLLHGTPRGEQLRWLLTRLRRLRRQFGQSSPQVVALSATVDDPSGICEAFTPDGVFVSVSGARTIQRVSIQGVGSTADEQVPAYIAGLRKPEKLLVFCNSRKRVDALTLAFSKQAQQHGYVVKAHHGSLSTKLREEAEEAARKHRKLLLVSSSTLEVGVDIGDIDLVVLDGPAPDIMSLLQRIGRGNRRTGETRVMACAHSITDALVQTAMLDAAESGYLGAKERGPQFAVARQQIASYIFQRRSGQRSIAQLAEFCAEAQPAVDASGLLQHLEVSRELIRKADAFGLGDEWKEAANSGAIHSNIESLPGQSVSDDKTGDEIATGVRFREGPAMKIAGRLLQVRDWDNFRVLVREMASRDGAEGKWNYVIGRRLRGAGQADAVRRFLAVPAGVWPCVKVGSTWVVFHFGGGRRRAIVEMAHSLRPGPIPVEVDEWAIYIPAASLSKPNWAEDITLRELKHLASQTFEKLERTLARPAANRALPLAMRVQEVLDWLRLESELECLAASSWQVLSDSTGHALLEELATDLV